MGLVDAMNAVTEQTGKVRRIGSGAGIGGLAFLLVVQAFVGLGALVVLPTPVRAYTMHAPILIDGDLNFTAANGVTGGTGTSSDPYVIEGWQIDASSAFGIRILNTDAYATIRGVFVYAGDVNYDGVNFDTVGNITVEGGVFDNNAYGINVYRSSAVQVLNNTVTNSFWEGILVESSSSAVVLGNDVTLSGVYGIDVFSSNDVEVRNNTASAGFETGIFVQNADQVIVTGNNASSNSIMGISLDYGSNVTIMDNSLWDNDYGIDFFDAGPAFATNNTIGRSITDAVSIGYGNNLTLERNVFTSNDGGVFASFTKDLLVVHNTFDANNFQGGDDFGERTAWDDGYPLGGNYWSDYAGVDACSGPAQDVCPDPDGIGDTPYDVDADTQDLYPLMAPYGPTDYTLTVLPPLPGDLYTVPWGINEAGDVVGWSTDGGAEHPFLFTDSGGSVALDLGTESRGTGRDINDAGIAAGGTYNPDPQHAMRWPAGGPAEDLGTLGTGPFSEAWGLNSTGAVVGTSDYGGPLPHGFLYTDAGGMIDVTPSAAGRAYDVNDAGVVVGTAGSRAIRWSAGVLEDLGAAGPFDRTDGRAINEAGQVAGCARSTTGTTERVARYTDGVGWQVLGGGGDTNCAKGINAYGDLVGQGRPTGTGILRAFLYTDIDGLLDLGTLVNPPLQYRLLDATDINDRGQVVGSAWDIAAATYVGVRLDPVVPPARKPVVTVLSPAGGEQWTGGSNHAVTWTMSDSQTNRSDLVVWVNYTADGTNYSPIAGPLTGATSTPWAVPLTDSATARVRVTVRDSTSLESFDECNVAFRIDATPPTLMTTSPLEGVGNAPPSTTITLAFSEAVDKAATRSAFSLQRTDTWAPVAGTFTDILATQIVFDPMADLLSGVTYHANLTTAARDMSVPGNFLASPFALTFTVVPVGPPSITAVAASPDPQEVGAPVNVTAAVTDPDSVAEVWLDVSGPEPLNASMVFDVGTGRYSLERIWSALGLHSFTIWARDVPGAWSSAVGSFTVVDTTKPAILHAPPTQAFVNTAIPLQADVTDNVAVAEVRVDYTDAFGASNVSMPGSGGTYSLDLPAQPTPGFVCYFLWAVDPSGNAARTDNATQSEGRYCITIVSSDPVPPTITAVQATPGAQQAAFPVNVSALVTDNIAVAGVWMSLTDPNSVTADNLTMALDAGSGRYFRSAAHSLLGTYVFTVYAKDTNDNLQSAAGSFQVIDTVPPIIATSGAAPDPQEVFLPVTFTAQVTDNAGVGSVFVSVLAPGGGTTNDTMAFSGGAWTASRAFGTLGVHVATVWAQDANGNWGSAAGTFLVVDTTRPAITGAVATPPLQGLGLAVTVSAQVTDNLAITGAWLEVVRPDFSATNDSMTAVGSLRSLAYTATLVGLHAWKVAAVDSAGNWAVATGAFTIVDATPPQILSVQVTPDPGQFGEIVTFTVAVTDNVGVAEAFVGIQGPSGPLANISMNTAGVGLWSYQTIFPELGTYAVVAWVRDAAGNWASSPASFDVVDTQPPTIASVTATPASAETPANVTLRAAITDNHEIAEATVNVTFPDGSTGNLSLAIQGDGTYAVTSTFAALGTYTATVWARDLSGNGAVHLGTTFVVVDTQTPAAMAGIDRIVAPGETVVFDASGSSDNVGIAEYRWTFTDSGGAVALVGPSPVHAFLVEGTFLITLRVTDASGNTATDTLTVVVAAPPVVRTAPVPPATVGAPVTFDASGSTGHNTSWSWTITDESGMILATLEGPIVTYTFAGPGNYQVNLTVTDTYGRSEKYGYTLFVAATGAGEASTWVPGLLAGGTVALVVAFGALEPGRVALLTATTGRVYGRKPKDAKDSELRGAILYYVRVHPGDCYMDIKRNLNLNDGVVTYHLAWLEKDSLIRSAVRGARKRYYPAGMRVPLENGGELHEIQQRILRFVASQPGMPVALVAEQAGVSYQLALYHLRRMTKSNFVDLERRGLRLHAVPGSAAGTPSPSQGSPPMSPPHTAPPPPPAPASPGSKVCPACETIVAEGDTGCFMCGATL